MGRGSSDLIGWTKVEGSAIYTAVEVKMPGGKTAAQRQKEQQSFIDAVNDAGGIAFRAYSVEEFRRLITEAIHGR